EPEAALATLTPLSRRLFLSREARRRAAGLYFRLGADQEAHALLLGQPFNERDPEDLRLREWSGRCQRAAALLRRAGQSADPAERVRLARAAHAGLPDAPGVLQWLVHEELLAMTQTTDRT